MATTDEPSDLAEILTAAREQMQEAPDGEIFDELNGVGSEAPTPAAPLATPTASETPEEDEEDEQVEEDVEDSAASAVRRALAMIEPDLDQHTEVDAVNETKPSGERLDPVKRPNGESYRPRIIEHLTDVELLQKARESEIPVMLSGFPGCGKTALTEAAFGEKLVTLNAHGDMEVTDLVGTYTQQPNGNYRWVDGPLVVAMKEGRPLFVDDITLAPATVLARLYPAMDGRGKIVITEHETETVIKEDGFFVVGAHNPGAPGAILAEPLRSRFTMPMVVETDLRMALEMKVDTRIVNATARLHDLRTKGTNSWAPEMRELLAFKRNQDVYGTAIAVNALIGSAPEEARDEICSTLRTWFGNAEILSLAAKS